MSSSGEVTSLRRPPVKEFTTEDLESIRLDTMRAKRPDQYEKRMAKLKIENQKAYDREMKKRKLATSTCESQTPAPTRIRNGPFIRKLEDVLENEPSGARLYIYPAGRRAFYKAPGGPAKSAMEISGQEHEEDEEDDEDVEETEGTDDALFVKRKKTDKAPKPSQKPERECQIKCCHCKSYQLVPRSQIRRISQHDEQEDSTSTL